MPVNWASISMWTSMGLVDPSDARGLAPTNVSIFWTKITNFILRLKILIVRTTSQRSSLSMVWGRFISNKTA